jgi:zinc protease
MNKVLRKAFALLAMLTALCAEAQQLPRVPMDSAIRYGKLPNGLTYYIRHNDLPRQRANFYIAQKVGSVQEDDTQRGLAHFLEHMCFNGSKNFEGNGIVNYCERIGVKFGQNLNAYTSTDETVYNIDDVPVLQSNIDSCLLILHDWADGLTLDPKEIDKERGVIHEEWRLRSSAFQRILQRQLPALYPGSKYGERMPIGLLSIIDSFRPQTLRAYYEKWYRPDLQGIVIVGDIDAAKLEQQVKALFSDIKMPENPAKYETYPVPDNYEAIYVVDKDKEQTTASINIMFKQEPIPDSLKDTPVFFARQYMINAFTMALNGRLDELSRKADCPFDAAGISYENYIMAKTKDALFASITPKTGRDTEAVKAVMEEIERARRFGFTDTEIYRTREEFMSRMEKVYDNRTKQKNPFFVDQYVRHFLESEPIPSIEDEYSIYKQITPAIGAGQISQMFAAITAHTDTNFVFLAFYPEKEGQAIPSAEEFKTAVSAATASQLEPYVDNVKTGSLVPELPARGKIVNETQAGFGYTCLKLSNGAKVYFKSTDFNDSQVILSAKSFGGYHKMPLADYANVQMFDNVMNSTGLGDFKQTELDKKLAGKQVVTTVSLDEYTESIAGSSTPKDLRTLFELLHLRFCKPSEDAESYQNTMGQIKTILENAEKRPETAFSDSLRATLYDHNPMKRRIVTADLGQVDYNAIRRIYSERFSSPGDFDFFFTGKIDADSLKAFAEIYIGSLPGCKKREKCAIAPEPYHKGEIENRFKRAMETPKAYIFTSLNGKAKYSMRNAMSASMCGDVLRKLYTRTVREEAGISYTVQADASLDYATGGAYFLEIICPTKPLKADSALLLINQGIDNIADKGVSRQDFDDVVKFKLKQFDDNQRNNGYWASVIINKVLYGIDINTGYEETLKSVTSADIQNFLKTARSHNNRVTITMLPENTDDKQ